MNHRIFLGAHIILSTAAATALAGCMMDDDEPCDAPAAGGSGAGPALGGAPGKNDNQGTGGTGSDESGTGGAGGSGGGDGPIEPMGLDVMTDHGPAPADFSCLGVHKAPSGKKSKSVTLDARAFGIADEMGNPVRVPGLEVQVFLNNQIPQSDACEAGCSVATDNGDGSYEFDALENGWVAYRSLVRPAGDSGPATLRTMETNLVAEPDEGFNTIFESVLDGLHASIAIPRDDEAALLAGRFLDCQGRPISGARVRLRDADGDVIAVNDETRPIYIGTMGPDPSLKVTVPSGQWSFINVPTHEPMIVVEMRSENDVLVACELAPVAPNAMSVLRVFPLRGDAPTICTK